VKPEVAEHVRRIAAELGFRPNRAGKILAARKQPLTIGCFLPSVENPFFDEVLRGYRAAERELSHYGVSLLIKEVEGYNPTVHLEGIRQLVAEGPGALCLTTVDVPEIRAYVDEVIAAGIPVVALNNDLTRTRRLCYVGTDYHRSGCVAASLMRLIRARDMNIVIVTGSLHVKGHNERIQGFSQTLRGYGVDYKLVDVFESQDNTRHAYNVTREILGRNPEVNCIYVAAAGAPGVAKAVTELGRQDDVLLACCDDIPEVRRLIRSGVIDFTICQEPWEQGYRAVELLFNHSVDRDGPHRDIITDTVVKIRENL
jgi:LacI family transcriptional regulator